MTNVFVNRTPVGRLTREEIYRFAYNEGVPPPLAVSLLMPVGEQSYLAEASRVLHPVFDMSLPEGPLRESLTSMFAKALPVFDDLALLGIVGPSLIGRLRFGADSTAIDEVPAQNLRDLLEHRGTGELFRDLLERYARYSGVAGVQPKFLIRDNGSLLSPKLSPVETGARITTHGTTHMVKAFDATKYPALALNEYWCMVAATACGLPVPRLEIARDGQLLVVERFDRKADGSYLGFEDGCSISGRLAREKYEGSYEQLARDLETAMGASPSIAENLEKFFRSLVLSIVVRNGDAHRKNFGVCYDDPTAAIWIAPTYDIVTTTAYLPKDTLALQLDGSKSWPTRKRLERFGIQRCQLSPAQAKRTIEEVLSATDTTLRHPPAAPDAASSEMLVRMKMIWNEGIDSLREH
jgi:serine/threonine-protein kinase HipA